MKRTYWVLSFWVFFINTQALATVKEAQKGLLFLSSLLEYYPPISTTICPNSLHFQLVRQAIQISAQESVGRLTVNSRIKLESIFREKALIDFSIIRFLSDHSDSNPEYRRRQLVHHLRSSYDIYHAVFQNTDEIIPTISQEEMRLSLLKMLNSLRRANYFEDRMLLEMQNYISDSIEGIIRSADLDGDEELRRLCNTFRNNRIINSSEETTLQSSRPSLPALPYSVSNTQELNRIYRNVLNNLNTGSNSPSISSRSSDSDTPRITNETQVPAEVASSQPSRLRRVFSCFPISSAHSKNSM